MELVRYGSKQLTRVDMGRVEVYFSYSTPVAIIVFDGTKKAFICKNEWSRTTGSHLNIIIGENPVYREVDSHELQELLGLYFSI